MGKARWRSKNRPAIRRRRRRLIFYLIPFLLLTLVFFPPLTATLINYPIFFQQGDDLKLSPNLLEISTIILAATVPGLENYYHNPQIPPVTSNNNSNTTENEGDRALEDRGYAEEGQVEYIPEGKEKEEVVIDNLTYRIDDPVQETAGIPQREPLILIYHTHASESFVPDTGKAFSQDPVETVVAAGGELKSIIEEKYGIGVIHHTGFYDADRRQAYQKARDDLEDIVNLFPSIEVVLDIHRDGVPRQVTTLTSDPVDKAKILLVAGTAQPKWQENYRFAVHLHNSLEESKAGLSRGVRRQNAAYNQDLHPRSLIVELGGYQNSMEEVSAALPYLAEALVKIVE